MVHNPPWSGGYLATSGDIFGHHNSGFGCYCGSSEQRLGILLNILQHTRSPHTAKTYLAHNVKRVQRLQNSAPGSQKKHSGWEPEPMSPLPVSEQSLASMPHPTPQAGNWIFPLTKLRGNSKCQGQVPKRRGGAAGKQGKGQV